MPLRTTAAPLACPEAAELLDIFADLDATLAELDLDAAVHRRLDGFASLPVDRDIPTYRGFVEGPGMYLTVSRHGEIVATFAAQPLVLAGTLTEHLETEGLYPQPWPDEDGRLVAEQWIVEPPARDITDAVKGLAVFTGGIWLAPHLRRSAGGDLSVHNLLIEGAVLGRIGRAAAYGLMPARHFFYFTKAGRAVAERFQPEIRPLAGVRWLRNGVELEPRVLGYMSPAFILDRVRALTASP